MYSSKVVGEPIFSSYDKHSDVLFDGGRPNDYGDEPNPSQR